MPRPREFDEQAVVAAAMSVFWEKGYQATSVQDLVNATGLQRGSLYGAFGDKRGLFQAALKAYGQGGLQVVLPSLSDSASPLNAVRNFVRMVAMQCTSPDGFKGCMMGNTCVESQLHDEATRDQLQLYLTTVQGALESALVRAQDLGELDESRNPKAMAAYVMCSIQGLNLIAKTRPGNDVIEMTVGEILRGLA